MANILIPPAWQQHARAVTPPEVYVNRRQILAALGFAGLGGVGVLSLLQGCSPADAQHSPQATPAAEQPPKPLQASRNERFKVTERPLTEEQLATRYNNFYEFTTDKDRVWQLARQFETQPWKIEIAGMAERRGTIDYDELLRIAPLEERIYRFRCVEAWAMTVPWVGFPLARFVEWCQPSAKATHIRFVSVMRPEQMPGIGSQPWYPWPYYEGLRMDEALNELALLTVGLYGKTLPPQNGAPVRVIVPWKYGYKSPKSIVRIEFTDRQPKTFWNDLAADEYSFLSNVDPGVPHPRWSQATEELIGTGERVPTQKYNGYGDYAAKLYA